MGVRTWRHQPPGGLPIEEPMEPIALRAMFRSADVLYTMLERSGAKNHHRSIDVLKAAVTAVEHAKRFTDNVEFSPEDATRSEPEFLVQTAVTRLFARDPRKPKDSHWNK